MDVGNLEDIAIPNYARGLRILVVDHDTTSLMHTASILEEQYYKVTTTELPTIALSIIRERESQYDLVIAEVNMPEMDGFTFLKHILFERDIPIILMTHKGNMEIAKKALNEGACFFWQKPIRVTDLINVWQHIFRNKLVKAKLQKVNEGNTSQEEESFMEKYKRKEESSCEGSEASAHRVDLEQKQRLIWTPELHHKFLKAVNALGDEKKAQPKAVLELMNIPNLTHRHVASHLQKHRLRVMRLSGNSGTSRPLPQHRKPYYGLQKKMDLSKHMMDPRTKESTILTNSSTGNPSSKPQLNTESSTYYGIEKLKELLKDVNCSSGNIIKNHDGKETSARDLNSRIISSGISKSAADEDIGVLNFEGGICETFHPDPVMEGFYSQGLENNFVEYFEDVPNLEVNGMMGVDDFSFSSPLEKVSMSDTEILKILEEELAPMNN